MPYIKTTSNLPISPATQQDIKTALGEHITLLGKTENWLMVDFCENSPLYFQGNSQPAAMVEVELYGEASSEAYQSFTAACTATLIRHLSVPPSRIFIRYAPTATWGWNGNNF